MAKYFTAVALLIGFGLTEAALRQLLRLLDSIQWTQLASDTSESSYILHMRVLFALPGLHKVDRGAEVAFISVANELAKNGFKVTLIGSGYPEGRTPYRYLHAASIARENFRTFPSMPLFRDDSAYEELTFVPDFLIKYRPADYDATLTCSYPFTNWILRRPTLKGRRPAHVFVTENGDWPAYSNRSEYRFFGCDGLVCTNPDFYERNRLRWHSRLIPNGIDCDRFSPGGDERKALGLPPDRPIVLMVSALIPSKRVDLGIEALRLVPEAHLVVAGGGPLQQSVEGSAAKYLPGRFTLLSVPAEKMPLLYRSANVFLHLSKEEAFGNVFLEAMASGLPIVAPDTSRVRWIVGNEQFLTQSDESSAIAAKLADALKADESLKASRVARAATFSWTKIALMYREFLREIVK